MHECPECCGKCSCLSGDIVVRNCEHCDDVLDENEDDEEDDSWAV